MKTNSTLLSTAFILLSALWMTAQNVSAPIITDDILASLKELDPKAPASDDVDFDMKNISSYSPDRKIIPADAVIEYRKNPEFVIGRMFADANNVVRVVLYRESSPAEKAQRESFLASIEAMKPGFFKGTYAKPFSITAMDGTVYTNESLKGKVVVVNFWFIGCAPCEEEMPVLNKLVEKYKNQEVVFLGVSFNKKAALETFLETKDFDYQIIPEGISLINDYKVISYPDHLVIDKQSVIQHKGGMGKDRVFDFLSQYIDLCLAAK